MFAKYLIFIFLSTTKKILESSIKSSLLIQLKLISDASNNFQPFSYFILRLVLLLDLILHILLQQQQQIILLLELLLILT